MNVSVHRQLAVGTPSVDVMTLAEDLFLITVSPHRHRPVLAETRLKVALAAAELADLALAGRITLDKEIPIPVVDPTPVGHPLLDQVLADLGAELAGRTPAGWLQSQASSRYDRYTAELVTQGAISCRGSRRPWLWLYPVAWAFLGSDGTDMVLDRRHEVVAIVKDKRRRSQALKRMRRAAHDASAPVEDRALAALAHAGGLRRSGPDNDDAVRPDAANAKDVRRILTSGMRESSPDSMIWLLAGEAQQVVHDQYARWAAQRAAEARNHEGGGHGPGSHGGSGHTSGGHGSAGHQGHHHGGHSGHSGFGGHGGHGGYDGHDGGHGW